MHLLLTLLHTFLYISWTQATFKTVCMCAVAGCSTLLRWSAHRFMLTGLLMLLTGHWTAQLSLLLLTSQLGHLIAASTAVCRWEHSEQGSFVVCQLISEFHNTCLPYITMPAICHVGWELPSTRFKFRLNLPSLLTCIILRYDNLNLPAN